MSKPLKIYVAGKVSKESHFGTHYWRDDFVTELGQLSGRKLIHLDPTKSGLEQTTPEAVFGADVYMIKNSDVLVVYLSDDISVGGSQEILIAKYYKKPVIGLAARGGKFNGSTKKLFGKVIKEYKDPFVFSTCDVVCATVEEVVGALKQLDTIEPKSIELIDRLEQRFQRDFLKGNKHLEDLL